MSAEPPGCAQNVSLVQRTREVACLRRGFERREHLEELDARVTEVEKRLGIERR